MALNSSFALKEEASNARWRTKGTEQLPTGNLVGALHVGRQWFAGHLRRAATSEKRCVQGEWR